MEGLFTGAQGDEYPLMYLCNGKMNRKYYLSFVLLTSIFTTALWGQGYEFSSQNKKALKNYAKAENAYLQKDNREAILYLHKAVKADRQFIEAWLMLGDAYAELKDNENALHAYEQAVEISPDFFPRVYYFIGNLRFDRGDYRGAITNYSLYRDRVVPGTPSFKEVENAIDQAGFAEYCVAHPVVQNIYAVNGRINSAADDYVNYVSQDGNRMILTRKELFDTLHPEQLYIERFYQSYRINDEWKDPDTLAISWDEGMSIGGMNISVDGRRMYFTGCNFPGGFGSCDLYFSFREGDRWMPPLNMGSIVNSQWWDSQPIISPDGKWLFYASRRTGGKGGSDLWMSIRLESGKWSPPINLGDSINTVGNEMAPFLHADGKTLYFSSDRHRGLGGSDLFVSRKDETGRWSKAKNLGYPINTHDNEINIVVSLDGKQAWLSSDREGGKGKVDIYTLEVNAGNAPHQVVFVNGNVKDGATGRPLGARIELTDLITSRVVDTTTSDRMTGEFLMVLQPGKKYAFNIAKKGYVFYSEHFNLDTTGVRSVNKDFLLSPLRDGATLVLNNLFFDFDRATIREVSYPELDRLADLLLANPSLHIHIAGHTDNVGDMEYNRLLSERRARAVFDYLAEKGIAPRRMEYKGYGDSVPVASNETAGGRAKNRRTEITFVE
ncbi:MAG: OmpA family protein [bacterium]